jgi:hypothetical protein
MTKIDTFEKPRLPDFHLLQVSNSIQDNSDLLRLCWNGGSLCETDYILLARIIFDKNM